METKYRECTFGDCRKQFPLVPSISFACEMPVQKDYGFKGARSYGLCGTEIEYGLQKRLDDLIVCPNHFERAQKHE